MNKKKLIARGGFDKSPRGRYPGWFFPSLPGPLPNWLAYPEINVERAPGRTTTPLKWKLIWIHFLTRSEGFERWDGCCSCKWSCRRVALGCERILLISHLICILYTRTQRKKGWRWWKKCVPQPSAHAGRVWDAFRGVVVGIVDGLEWELIIHSKK